MPPVENTSESDNTDQQSSYSTLPRDDQSEITETLRRLKSSSDNNNPTIYHSAINESPARLFRSRYFILIILSLSIIALIGFIGLTAINYTQNSNQTIVQIEVNNVIEIEEKIADFRGRESSIIDFQFAAESSESSPDDQARFYQQVFSELGISNTQRLALNLRSNVVIQKSGQHWLSAWAVYDPSLATASLRQAESNLNISGSSPTGNTWQDSVVADDSFRTNGEMVYLIDNNVVMIGSDPEFLQQHRSEIISRLQPLNN
jgi:hypothetical protein